MKGVIYCMSTTIPEIIRIGHVDKKTYEKEVHNAKLISYNNIICVNELFALETENHKVVAEALYNALSNCRVGDTELFVMDSDKAVGLLRIIKGYQIYPLALNVSPSKGKNSVIPNGEYYFNYHCSKNDKIYKAVLRKDDDGLWLVTGSEVCFEYNYGDKKEFRNISRENIKIEAGMIAEDTKVSSVSTAAGIVTGMNIGGWDCWTTKNGIPISRFRN